MLKLHVLPDFHSPVGFLRQRACSVYGHYAESLFKNANAAADSQIAAVFVECLRLMTDPDLPVRVQVTADGVSRHVTACDARLTACNALTAPDPRPGAGCPLHQQHRRGRQL